MITFIWNVLTVLVSLDCITKYHRLGGLNNLLSHSSGAWKLEIQIPAWLGSGEASLPPL